MIARMLDNALPALRNLADALGDKLAGLVVQIGAAFLTGQGG